MKPTKDNNGRLDKIGMTLPKNKKKEKKERRNTSEINHLIKKKKRVKWSIAKDGNGGRIKNRNHRTCTDQYRWY